MIKKLKILLLVVVITLLVLFSPTIISSLILFAKFLNSGLYVKSIGTNNWLVFYATMFGGICTLLAFIFSYFSTKKQINKQHEESLRAIIHQDEMNNFSEVNKSLSALIQAFNSSSQLRNIYQMIFDAKYSDALLVIEELRSTIVLNRNNFFLVSDIKQIESGNEHNLDECNYLKEYTKIKDELYEVVRNLENIYMNVLQKSQSVVDTLYKNDTTQKEINSIYHVINTAENLNTELARASQEDNSLEIEVNKDLINEKRDLLTNATASLIPKETIDKRINELNNSMEEYNTEIVDKMTKLLDLSKKYLELKKFIRTEKLK